jgi:HK97 family phage major capsid protein
MATDYESLIPVSVAREVLASAEARSAILALSRTQPMPAGVESIPVVSVAPVAKFVNPRYGGRKPQTAVEWTAERIEAEELACIVPIPNAFIDDAGFPVWNSVRDEVAKAIAYAIDAACLNGDDAPASFPVGGLVAAAGAPVGGASETDAIDDAMGQVEELGFDNTGIVGGSKLKGLMRKLGTGLVVPTDTPPTTIWGLNWQSSPAWDYTAGDELVGDWDYSVVGIREDIRFDLSTEGVITDDAGKVIVNAFQDDSTLMRCYMRLGYVIGKALPAPNSAEAGTPTAPFAIAKTGAAARAAKSSWKSSSS